MRSDPELRIPLTAPDIGSKEAKYVQDALDTGWVSSAGPYVDRFEAAMAERLGVTDTVAVASGTAALHLALAALEISEEDEVLVPSLTFIAPANAVRYVGAVPVFVDVSATSWQMDPLLVQAFLDERCISTSNGIRNKASGRRIGAILVVHTLGLHADLAPILGCAERYSIPVIEDASESLATGYLGAPVGTLGTVGCFSFNGNKLITAGAGGLLVSGSPDILGRMRYLSTQARDDPKEYIHHSIGFNYRMSNIHAALGTAQSERLDDFAAAKRRIAHTYQDHLQESPEVTLMPGLLEPGIVPWLVTILLDPSRSAVGSRELIDRLEREGIEARPLWQPLHRSLAHAGAEFIGGGVADHLYARAVSLPSSVSLRDDQISRIASIVSTATRRP